MIAPVCVTDRCDYHIDTYLVNPLSQKIKVSGGVKVGYMLQSWSPGALVSLSLMDEAGWVE